MCYRPMATGMERIKTLTNLRHSNIEFPDDFNELEMESQVNSWFISIKKSQQLPYVITHIKNMHISLLLM
jgi:hypothetical protein